MSLETYFCYFKVIAREHVGKQSTLVLERTIR